MYGFKTDRSYDRERVLWVLPTHYNKSQKALSVKEINAKTGINPKVISTCLQTLKNQGKARRYRGDTWRRTRKI